MRVLLVISKYLPEYTGAARRLHDTYKRLRERDSGLSCRVVCNAIEFAGNERYEHDGVPVRRIASRLPGNGRVLGALKFWLEAAATLPELLRRDFDLIHVAGMSASTAAAIWWARAHDTPLIVELVTKDASPDQGLPGLRRLWRPALRRGTVVIAISQALGDTCARLGLTRNVWVRPNPVDTDRFFPELERRNELRGELTPFSAQDCVLAAVAKFMPQKNQIFLLDVLAQLPPEYKLVLAGPVVTGGRLADRDHGYIDRIRARIEELGLADRVLIETGFVDIARYIKLADVYCMPNHTEGLGTPMLESLACAVPVIANRDEPAFREWVKDGMNGWLRPLDPAAWAEALRQIRELSTERLLAEADAVARQASTDRVDAGYRAILHACQPRREVDVSAVLAENAA